MTVPLHQVWAALDGAGTELPRLRVTGPSVTLRSSFAVTEAAAAAVGASLLAATLGSRAEVGLDTRGLAVALRSEQYLLRDGASPGSPFDPLSAFHRTADGWLRLHANYPWHRAAALRVLGCAEADAPAVIAARGAVELETALHRAGGVGAAVRTEPGWRAVAGPPPPLVEHAAARARTTAAHPPRPGAGPDPGHRRPGGHPHAGRARRRRAAPGRPGPPGARPAVRGRAARQAQRAARPGHRPDVLEELLAGADVVVTGYRPGRWTGSGCPAPRELAERHPGLALDHITGYLVAAAALLGLARQRRDGGSHLARLSLVGTAAWLQGLPRSAVVDIDEVDPAPHLVELDAPDGRLTIAAPPGTVDGRPLSWPDPPPSFGTAEPRWR